MSEQQSFRRGAAYALRYVVDELGLDITDCDIWSDFIDDDDEEDTEYSFENTYGLHAPLAKKDSSQWAVNAARTLGIEP